MQVWPKIYFFLTQFYIFQFYPSNCRNSCMNLYILPALSLDFVEFFQYFLTFEENSEIQFLVFMCHIPELKITFPSEVLVSSDRRPYRNLTFHYVLSRQGSSFCNRARLIFQAFALRDMKMAAREGCRVGQRMSYSFSFCYLNSACTRRSIYFNVPKV